VIRAPFVMGKAEAALGRGQTLEDTTMGWRFVKPALNARYGTEAMSHTGEHPHATTLEALLSLRISSTDYLEDGNTPEVFVIYGKWMKEQGIA
jgi:hypothetical protein